MHWFQQRNKGRWTPFLYLIKSWPINAAITLQYINLIASYVDQDHSKVISRVLIPPCDHLSSIIVSTGWLGCVGLWAPLRKHHNTAIAFYGTTFSTQPLKIWRKLGCVTLGCSTFKVKLTWDMNMSNEGEVFLQPRTTSRPRFTLDWEDEKVWPHSCKWPGAQQGPGRCNGKHQTGSPGLLIWWWTGSRYPPL